MNQSSPRLRGSLAFRDLGGAPTRDGRRLAPGRLFRADALGELEADDRAVIDALGLKLVCDLRSSRERERNPCLQWLVPSPERLHFDVGAALTEPAAPALNRLRRGPDPEAAAQLMLTTYAGLPLTAAASMGTLLARLAAGEFPLLLHCSAGKDRTGFFTAMLLVALDVEPEYIERDYLLGPGCNPLGAEQPAVKALAAIVGRQLMPEESNLLHGVRREFIAASFEAIERGWGGPLPYLEQAAGLDASLRSRLRERLLE